ncbi:MAG: phosphogluconate dehydratase, partial [Aureispira sp.]
MNEVVKKITDRIIERSKPTRELYLKQMKEAEESTILTRTELSCGNLAHAFAACSQVEKDGLTDTVLP